MKMNAVSLWFQIRMHWKHEHLRQTMHSKTEPYAFDYFFEQTTRCGERTGQHESSSSSDSDHEEKSTE